MSNQARIRRDKRLIEEIYQLAPVTPQAEIDRVIAQEAAKESPRSK